MIEAMHCFSRKITIWNVIFRGINVFDMSMNSIIAQEAELNIILCRGFFSLDITLHIATNRSIVPGNIVRFANQPIKYIKATKLVPISCV